MFRHREWTGLTALHGNSQQIAACGIDFQKPTIFIGNINVVSGKDEEGIEDFIGGTILVPRIIGHLINVPVYDGSKQNSLQRERTDDSFFCHPSSRIKVE